LEELESLERLESSYGSYADVDILPSSTVYCDIPYVGTVKYKSGEFDHRDFYQWALSREFPVFVSEYQMPDDFAPIAVKGKRGSFKAYHNSTVKAERIYVQRRYAKQYQRDLFIGQDG
jgi:DNA adenine methylase